MTNRKSANRKVLYHLLPVVFWLLAIGGSLVPLLLDFQFSILHTPFSVLNYSSGSLVAAIVLICILILSRIKRHSSSVEQCFQVALLLGVASYWLPTVLFLILPIWMYLIYRNLFSFRSFVATLIGFALVAVWGVLLNYFSFLTLHSSLTYNLCAWIPSGAILLAWLASTIARQILRER